MLWGVVREVQLRCDLPLLNSTTSRLERSAGQWSNCRAGDGPARKNSVRWCPLKNTIILADSDDRGTRGKIDVGLSEAGDGFTKRVGCANMHHNGAARRRWSRAWSGAMRLQARCACARDARSKEVEQVFAFLTRGSASLHPGLTTSAALRRKA